MILPHQAADFVETLPIEKIADDEEFQQLILKI